MQGMRESDEHDLQNGNTVPVVGGNLNHYPSMESPQRSCDIPSLLPVQLLQCGRDGCEGAAEDNRGGLEAREG